MDNRILDNKIQDILIDFQSNLSFDEDFAYEVAHVAISSLLAKREDETVKRITQFF